MRNDTIRSLLPNRSEIAVGDQLLDVCLSDLGGNLFPASWHPLGFIHVKPAQFPNARIHIWPLSAQNLGQDCRYSTHNHSFAFRSQVICGAMENTTYRIVHNRNGNKKIFSVSYDGKLSILTPTEVLVDSEILKISRIDAGASYKIACDEFHSTVAEPGTLTILEAIEMSGISPVVIGPMEPDSAMSFSREICDFEKLQSLLDEIRGQTNRKLTLGGGF